jgi:hypothetical protein
MVDCFDACKVASSDLERRVRKYADEDPTELPLLPAEEGQAEADRKRMPTRQQQAIGKLDDAVRELQSAMVTRSFWDVGGGVGLISVLSRSWACPMVRMTCCAHKPRKT